MALFGRERDINLFHTLNDELLKVLDLNCLNKILNVKKGNILILAVIDLPDLGGSKLIANQGYEIETLVSY